MKNKTLILTLAISGLIRIGETANAITFSCLETLDVSKFTHGRKVPYQSSYIYKPESHDLALGVYYSHNISPGITIPWGGSGHQVAERDNPESKDYELQSATFLKAFLGDKGEPVCLYKFNFSGLIFPNQTSSYYLNLTPKTSVGIYHCTLSGTAFTCP